MISTHTSEVAVEENEDAVEPYGAKESLAFGEPHRLRDLIRLQYPSGPSPLIENGILDRSGRMLIVGPAKSHKTTFAINIAICLAGGLNFPIGAEDPSFIVGGPIRVLYVNLEVGEIRFAQRLRNIRESLAGQDESVTSQLDSNLFVWTPRSNQRPKLDDAHGHLELDRLISSRQPRVLIIDTLRRAHNSDENGSTEMANVFAEVDAIASRDVAVILVHHTGKPGIDGKPRGQHSPRGTSDFEGYPDTLLWFEPKGSGFRVGSAVRNGPPVSFYFTVDPETFLVRLAEGLTQVKGKSDKARSAILSILKDGEVAQPEVVRRVVEAKIAGQTTAKDVVRELESEALIRFREVKEGNRTVHYLSLGAVQG